MVVDRDMQVLLAGTPGAVDPVAADAHADLEGSSLPRAARRSALARGRQTDSCIRASLAKRVLVDLLQGATFNRAFVLLPVKGALRELRLRANPHG